MSRPLAECYAVVLADLKRRKDLLDEAIPLLEKLEKSQNEREGERSPGSNITGGDR